MNINQILNKSSDWLTHIRKYKDILLSNLIMIGQMPAPPFKEETRSKYVIDRFIESGLAQPYTDEYKNAIGIIPGKNTDRNILVSAHIDTLFPATINHNISIQTGKATGPGVADSSMGIATLITLPDIINSLDVEFDSNIILLGSARSIGRGDLNGIRHFIVNNYNKIDYSIGLMGIDLGRVNHFCYSNVKCDIKCDINLEETYVSSTFGYTSAVIILNDIVNGLLSIPIPRRPKTVLNIGHLSSGEAYDMLSSRASISLEIRSEDNRVTDNIMKKVASVCKEVGLKHDTEIDISFFGRQHAAGISFNHPLVQNELKILEYLNINPKIGPAGGELTVPLSKKIPSINIGITYGKKSDHPDGYIEIKPIIKGVLQLLLLIYMIDKGLCDGSKEVDK